MMASITIRKLDDALKERLRVRAARNGRSMEAEATEILRIGLARTPSEPNLLDAMRKEPFGAVELPIPPREPLGRLRMFRK